jgi:hypothetical protein
MKDSAEMWDNPLHGCVLLQVSIITVGVEILFRQLGTLQIVWDASALNDCEKKTYFINLQFA